MIVIPMAGLSRRFTLAGYDKPKYMLPLHGGTVFDHAVRSFEHYFDATPFLFVVREEAGTPRFVQQACRNLGIRSASVVTIDGPTAGQAETVELGLRLAGTPDNSPITIFNIDTFRPGFRFPDQAGWGVTDGYLEVFEGSGANWSYVRPAADGGSRVAETAEKRLISNLCCSGLYHFGSAGVFRAAVKQERQSPSAPELYVAPLYNHLIAESCRIHYQVIGRDSVTFCGIPEEYCALVARMKL